MTKYRSPRDTQQASILLGTLCYLFITIGLVLTILALSSNHRKLVTRQVNMEQAMYVAEGGMERGARFIESNLVALVVSSSGATNGTGTIGAGTYTYGVSRVNQTTYQIVSTGTVNGVKRNVSLLRVYQPTYAEFALWSHTNGGIYFKAGEVFTGRVHADDQLWFSGNPIFHAAVTSGASTYGGDISNVEFDKGLSLNAYEGQMADVDFNTTSSSLKSTAQAGGLVLTGNTTITFNGSSVRITNSRAGYSNYSYTPPAEGIIYIANATSGTTSTKPGTVYLVGGNVTGRLTIVTETDMHVQGNIRYTTDPRVNANSTDALGLISRNDITVDTSAPNNLEIDAAMIATGTAGLGNGSFSVTNYDSGSARGTLTIYGGIVQDLRGAVGTFNQSTGQTTTGFNKNYSYDSRFIKTPPPYYPVVAGKVEFNDWREGH